MDKSAILELLKEVKYPGFTRDIVSFGMVEDVIPAGDAVTVKLKISTQREEKRQAIVAEVKSRLERTGQFKQVTVEVTTAAPTPQIAIPQETPSTAIHGEVQRILAIASGKGGVGKSTVAANIAAVLKERYDRVGLLDLDIYGPSLPIILGFNDRPQITADRKLVPLERYGLKVMSFGFLSGNETPVIWRGPLVARMTEQFFADVEWGKLDYLVLDLPPGTGDVQLTLTQKIRISGAIIVTTPQDIALADVRKGADMFRKVNAPVLGVVENLAGLQVSGTLTGVEGPLLDRVQLQFDDGQTVKVDAAGRFTAHFDLFKHGGGARESERLGVPLLGEIPIAREIMEATDAGMPIVLSRPDSDSARIFRTIVDNIETHL
jgi:ATP-binding protein involved in chromosome partitioning